MNSRVSSAGLCRVLPFEIGAACVVAVERFCFWVGLLALTLGSYAWWGSPSTPLRRLLPVAALCGGVWVLLLVADRLLLRTVRARCRLNARVRSDRPEGE